jgi:RNA polymerase sigma-70 factor (ECF subfamily)
METADRHSTRPSLLERVKDPEDKASWEAFYAAYWRLIHAAGLQAGLSEEEAKDLVQDTFVVLARRMPEFECDPAKCSFKSWLRLVVRCRIRDRLRKQGRQLPTVDLPPTEDTATEPLQKIADPATLEPDPRWDEEWEKNLMQVAVDRVRSKIGAPQLQIYLYHVLQGHGVPATCKALGVSAPQVYLAKHRVGRLVRIAAAQLKRELA